MSEGEDLGRNPFPYGTAEHLGYELMVRFSSSELPAYVLWHEHVKNPDGSVVSFLDAVLERYGVEIAQFCALYLKEFETMPTMMDMTRERLILGMLDSGLSEA